MTFPPQGGPQGPFDPRNPNDPRNANDPRTQQDSRNPNDPQNQQDPRNLQPGQQAQGPQQPGQGRPGQGQQPNHGRQGPSGPGAYGSQQPQSGQQPQYGQHGAPGSNSNSNSNSPFGSGAASAYGQGVPSAGVPPTGAATGSGYGPAATNASGYGGGATSAYGAPSAVTPGYATPNGTYASPNSTYGVPGTGYGAPTGAPPVGNQPAQGFGYQQQPSGYLTPGAPGSEFGAGSAAAQPGKTKRNSRLLLVLAIPAAALIAGLGGYFIGESNGSVLAAEPLQAEVTRVLQDDFGLVEVSDVVCPEQVKVDQGSEFQCTFTYAEQDQSVTVTVSSADGQVVVGAPE